jgi:hypothetical protein
MVRRARLGLQLGVKLPTGSYGTAVRFATGTFQSAIAHQQDHAGDDYRPGNSTTFSFGLRYVAQPHCAPPA